MKPILMGAMFLGVVIYERCLELAMKIWKHSRIVGKHNRLIDLHALYGTILYSTLASGGLTNCCGGVAEGIAEDCGLAEEIIYLFLLCLTLIWATSRTDFLGNPRET